MGCVQGAAASTRSWQRESMLHRIILHSPCSGAVGAAARRSCALPPSGGAAPERYAAGPGGAPSDIPGSAGHYGSSATGMPRDAAGTEGGRVMGERIIPCFDEEQVAAVLRAELDSVVPRCDLWPSVRAAVDFTPLKPGRIPGVPTVGSLAVLGLVAALIGRLHRLRCWERPKCPNLDHRRRIPRR